MSALIWRGQVRFPRAAVGELYEGHSLGDGNQRENSIKAGR